MPLRRLESEPGQDRKVAALSSSNVCDGFYLKDDER